jgi:hypothetical protein
MVVDAWRGLLVYRSPDALNWTLQEELLLDVPGTGLDDGVIGGHPDVVVNQGKVYLFYFTHPGRRPGAPAGQTEQRRSSIQVVELRYENGALSCATGMLPPISGLCPSSVWQAEAHKPAGVEVCEGFSVSLS